MTPTRLLLTIALVIPATMAAQVPVSGNAGIERFNHAFDQATRTMDNAATIALWEDDGISLLPSTKPIVGKAAIGGMITGFVASNPAAHMKSFDDQCYDLEVSGDWASEWCLEHQVVQLSATNTFDGWGKMLLVLHRGTDGVWRLRREMWNQATGNEGIGH